MKKEEALSYLKKILNPEDTIYGIIKHVAKSGMSRSISFIYICEDRKPLFLDGVISNLFGYKLDLNNGGLKISGCGMDMIFKVVYDISEMIFEGQDRAGYLINSRQI